MGVPVEKFRTQVLLLHSKQSTLDKLRSEFGDRYTIHCATSGSEALNTLATTPIHVIVSAQDLPGMSGIEALREARKRSPETRGILLTGSKGKDLETLVGTEEIFRVVHGIIAPDALRDLVDQAAQQMQLFALGRSANDQSATPLDAVSPDDASHTGATAVTAPAARAVDVLVLSKDSPFVHEIRKSAAGAHHVHVATTLAKASEAVGSGKVGVVVIDSGIVGRNVEKLTEHLRRIAPRLVAIVAGRRDDGEMLMDLVNRGSVYRFLLKPVSPGRVRLAIEASIKHHLEAPEQAFTREDQATQDRAGWTSRAAPEAEGTPGDAQAESGADALSSTAQMMDLSHAFDDVKPSLKETIRGVLRATGAQRLTSKEPETAPPDEAEADDAAEVAEAAPAGSRRRPEIPKMLLGIGAAAAVAVVGLWIWSGGEPEVTEPVAGTDAARPAATSDPVSGQPSAVTADGPARLREAARRALEAGQIFNPAGSNAIEFYLAAVQSAPDDADLKSELNGVLDLALAKIESALLERRTGEAAAGLGLMQLADPDHPRLPFLDAQLTQIELQNHLDAARVALRESRLEDAAKLLDAARALEPGDTPAIESLVEDLRKARGQQRVEEVLALASARLEEGMLVSPSNYNARYFYELVLSNDPENATARQGLEVVASRLVLQARTAIDAGDFAAAENHLAAATELDPESSELKASTDALVAARERAAADARRAAARRAATQARKKQDATRQAAARQARDRQAAAEPADPQADAGAQTAVDEAATTARTAPNPADSAGGAVAQSAGQQEPAPEATVPAGDARESRDARMPVAVSKLKRTKYVAPKYPRAAQRRNVSGWVDVLFTVTTEGRVSEIEVRDSAPGDTFVSAAINAIEKWRFEPVIEDDVAVEQRAAVRLMFALE